MFLLNVDKYRPIPFWSWNDKLMPEILKNQIGEMSNQGIGGFIMHARGGLETEYMEKDWFDSIDECVKLSKKNNMHAFAYDENGWPSGFGNGIVTSRGEQYIQKYLRFEKGEGSSDRTIANVSGYHFYYDVNIHYVDLLMRENTACFIENIYKPYLTREKKVDGFFTDEPQMSRNGYPWSVILPDEYKREYNEDIKERLPELFFELGDWKNTRIKYWRLVTKLFSKNFFEPLYEYAKDNDIILTGHLLLEESLIKQLTPNGSAMPHYRYFHIPGIDLLGRDVAQNRLAPIQLSSVAAQFGKKQVLSESYAMTGWGLDFAEMFRIFDHQAVRGISFICNHLAPYSIRGIRKRDYPPAMFYQQPWWQYYSVCSDYFARVGYLIGEGESMADTLLLHPQTSAWVSYNGNDNNEEIEKLNDSFLKTIDSLESKHILFHLGDELIMEDEAFVRDGRLCIGLCSYKTLIIPKHITFMKKTLQLIDEFKKSGGRVCTEDELIPSLVCDSPEISYTARRHKDYTVHYFVNSADMAKKVNISVGDCIYDAVNDKLLPFEKNTVIEAGTSLITLSGVYSSESIKKDLLPIECDNIWTVENSDENALLLDKCQVFFGTELIGDNMHILEVGEMANSLKRELDITLISNFKAEYVPSKLSLVCEISDSFNIFLNGHRLSFSEDYYIDPAMKKADIAKYTVVGDNEIKLCCRFFQDKEVYDNIDIIHECEVVKNKFTYNMELEAMYIIGDFSLRCPSEFKPDSKKSLRYMGEYIISSPKRKIDASKLVSEGYPFFSGNMTLTKDISCIDTNYKLKLKDLHSVAVDVKVNEKSAGLIFKQPFELDLSSYLTSGENKLSLTLVGTLRNLFGPHHMAMGESGRVCPSSFYKDTKIWGDEGRDDWRDDYCFVKSGFEM